MTTQNRRKWFSLNLDGRPQKHFILLEFVLMMLTMIYLLYLIFGTIDQVLKTVPLATPSEQSSFFEQLSFLLLVRISILFIVVFAVHILCGLFFLHRLTGPLIRTQRILREIADGETPPSDIAWRRGDFPSELARELSRAIKRIRSYQRKA